MNKVLIDSFKNVGTEEISIVNNETVDSMIQVFTEYPNNFFKQKDFVKILKKSNPFINHCLHKLLKDNIINKSGTKRLYYYKLIVRK